MMTEEMKEEIAHQVDVITDSDWFMELVEAKAKKIIKEMRNADDTHSK